MTDCLIIGGGIIGMLTARELSSAGVRVTLLDRRQTGRESSWAGGGILSPLHPWRYPESVTALALWGQRHYPDLLARLQDESGVDPQLVRNGLLVLDPDDPERALAWGEAHSIDLQIIDGAEIKRREPGIAGDRESAIWMPDVAQVRNPRLVRGLRQAIAPRVEVREDIEVEQILTERGQVRGVRAGGAKLHADQVIVCAGAWSARLLAGVIPAPDIEPVRGQMILYRARPGLVTRILLRQDRYLIPRRDGRVLVGSTLEHAGFDKRTTGRARESLQEATRDLFPALTSFPVEHHWAGLRPGSPRGIPYIGEHPSIRGLYVNSGHFRNGVVLAPASARLLGDIVLDRPPVVDPAPYALDSSRAL